MRIFKWKICQWKSAYLQKVTNIMKQIRATLLAKRGRDSMCPLASKFMKAISRPYLIFPERDLMEVRERVLQFIQNLPRQNENLVEET